MRPIQLASLLSAALCGALFSTPAQAIPGPTSTLYAMNYLELSGNTVTGMDMIQGLSVTTVPTSYTFGICIATYGDVRTQGYGSIPTTEFGERFDLAGNPLPGGPYQNTVTDSQLHDGTSDGNYNYAVDYVTGNVIEFDRNWASPNVLFNATVDLPNAGWITMNALDGSFWLAPWGGGNQISHFTHTGTLLSTFYAGSLPALSGLALDPIDGTLWFGYTNSTPNPTLYQYDQAGNFLQSQQYAVTNQWYGMEFDTTPVPEPGTFALLAIGVVGIVIAFRQRRRAA